MRILCGYNTTANLHPETYRALIANGLRTGVPVDFVDVSGDPGDYWRAIAERWTGEDDLVLVEQDNVITAETLPSFWGCDKDWCVFSYAGWPGWGENFQLTHSLGCTYFSARLQKKVPVKHVADTLPWHAIDIRIETLLQTHGYDTHVHGEVKHLHDYANDPRFAGKTCIQRLPDGRTRISEPQPDGSFKITID